MTYKIRKNKVKTLIKKIVRDNYKDEGKLEISSRILQNNIWDCSWYISLDLPPNLDTSVRTGIEFDPILRNYCERKYKEIIQFFRTQFGMVKHERKETEEKLVHFLTNPVMVIDSFSGEPDMRRTILPGWYNLTMPLPPTDLIIPADYEFVTVNQELCKTCVSEDPFKCSDCDNRKSIKIADARWLTEAEIEIRKQASAYFKDMIEYQLATKHHWELTGDSPFTDECLQLKSYSGIFMSGSITFPAVDIFEVIKED